MPKRKITKSKFIGNYDKSDTYGSLQIYKRMYRKKYNLIKRKRKGYITFKEMVSKFKEVLF